MEDVFELVLVKDKKSDILIQSKICFNFEIGVPHKSRDEYYPQVTESLEGAILSHGLAAFCMVSCWNAKVLKHFEMLNNDTLPMNKIHHLYLERFEN